MESINFLHLNRDLMLLQTTQSFFLRCIMGNCLDVYLGSVHYSSKNCHGNSRCVLLHATQIVMSQFGFEFKLMLILVMEHPVFFRG